MFDFEFTECFNKYVPESRVKNKLLSLSRMLTTLSGLFHKGVTLHSFLSITACNYAGSSFLYEA